MRVYLIEPSPLVRERLQRVLAQHPAVQLVGSCDCAQDAEQHLRRLWPDLVILELNLREGNAFQLLSTIGCWPLRPEIIVMTDSVQEPMRRAARQLGVRHFYDKALEFEQVIDALGDLLCNWVAQDKPQPALVP